MCGAVLSKVLALVIRDISFSSSVLDLGLLVQVFQSWDFRTVLSVGEVAQPGSSESLRWGEMSPRCCGGEQSLGGQAEVSHLYLQLLSAFFSWMAQLVQVPGAGSLQRVAWSYWGLWGSLLSPSQWVELQNGKKGGTEGVLFWTFTRKVGSEGMPRRQVGKKKGNTCSCSCETSE